MSTQIAVRLPEEMVSELDELIAAGEATSRASVIEQALRRELRRYLAERDLRILEATGEDTDLLAATEWAVENFSMDD